MLLSASSSSFSSSPHFPFHHLISQSPYQKHTTLRKSNIQPPFVCLTVGVEDVAQVLHNKVLLSSTVASGIGQLAKPFTAVLYGRGVDFKAAIRSGGMPSTHSAAVVAAATALGLERGFADSIFGMSAVFAAIVMYDAQGVRKEVGLHAKVINTTVITGPNDKKNSWKETSFNIPVEEFSLVSSKSLSSPTSISENGRSSSVPLPPLDRRPNSVSSLKAFAPPSKIMAVNGEEESTTTSSNRLPLKESVGHTVSEVFVGALLGFVVCRTREAQEDLNHAVDSLLARFSTQLVMPACNKK